MRPPRSAEAVAAPAPEPPAADAVTRRWNLGLAFAAAAAWAVAVAATTGQYVASDGIVSGDFHQHGYWTLRFLEPGLFPNDPVTAYFAGPAAPPLYAGLYRVLVPLFGDPQAAMEAVVVALAAAVAWLAWRLGAWAGGGRRPGGTRWRGVAPAVSGTRGVWPAFGGLAAVLTLAYVQLEDVQTVEPAGLQRAFGLPLTLALALALAQRRRVLTGVVLLLTAGLYPVLVAGLGFLAFCVELRRLVADRRLPRGWFPLAACAAGAVAIVVFRPSPPWLGDVVTLAEARVLPEFNAGGRQQFFGSGWERFWFRSDRSGIGFRWERLLVAAGLTAGGIALAGRRSVPPLAWAALLTGLALFAAAHLLLFHLYLPQRYTIYNVPLFGLLAAGGIAATLGARIVAWLDARKPAATPEAERLSPLDRFGPWAVPLVAAAVFGLLAREQLDNYERRVAWAQTSRGPAYAALMDDLQRTPIDTVVAGVPNLVNDLPYRGHRTVLLTREQALAYHRGFYLNVILPRYEAALTLANARSLAEADAAADAAGVDLWIVRIGHDDGGRGKPERPLDELDDQLAARPGEPVLADPPPERIFARHGDWALVRIGRGGLALPDPSPEGSS